VALALDAWARTTRDAAAGEGAERVLSAIADRAPTAGGCTDVISGDAGVLLTLLTAPAQSDLPKDRLAAVELLAERLVEVAEADGTGLQWRMEASWEYLMPGFSHGTAGVAYALATAERVLGRADLVAVAVRGAEALLAAGHQDGGWALPRTMPARPGRPAVAYGWCHGPTGTMRLFILLDEIDPAPRWCEATDACLQALRDSRLPERLYPGYWDNLARCCGTAGVGQLLLDRYQATGDPDLLTWTDTLAADVLDRVLPTPPGIAWSNTEHKDTPPQLPPKPGFMQGTAGIARWLSRLRALRADPTAIRPGPAWL
jgi:lantibiotic modifying enzyme